MQSLEGETKRFFARGGHLIIRSHIRQRDMRPCKMLKIEVGLVSRASIAMAFNRSIYSGSLFLKVT